jgi:predicted Zn-dependent peptidase
LLSEALLYGEGLAELREFEARIEAVSGAQMQDAAARWLDPARLVVGVVRGGPEGVD